ncbi:hypothetical protein BJ742DRAFT_775282 [Cladochytrium replicatum]|nr:hypothetical protein BJ742DRAFT_775282 [Cladochytrium replicatum]
MTGSSERKLSDLELRRLRVDQQFGVGAFDEAMKKMRPHRCNAHLEDFFDSVVSMDRVWEGFSLFVKCMGSQKGQEPSRIQRAASTSSS